MECYDIVEQHNNFSNEFTTMRFLQKLHSARF